jgi:LysM repeat protein
VGDLERLRKEAGNRPFRRYDAAPDAKPGAAATGPEPMKKKSSWIARIIALAALVAAVIAIIVVASNTDLSSDSGNKGPQQAHPHKQKQQQKQTRTKKKTYTVQSGDTLISIAHKTHVPVAELQALNPEVDPQILVAGEVLKLQK